MTLRVVLVLSLSIILTVAVVTQRDRWGRFFEGGSFSPRDELLTLTER